MREIVQYLKNFYTDHLNKYDLILALLFVAGFSYLNYGTSYIDDMKRSFMWKYELVPFLFILYLVPFLFGFLIQSITHRDWSIWKDPKFIFLTLFAIALFTFRGSMHLYVREFIESLRGTPHWKWTYNICLTVLRMLALFVPIAIYWFFVDRKKMPYYGFTLKNFNTKPYFVMLAIMLPLIVLASTQSDFLGTYPRGVRFDSLEIGNPEHRPYFILYEFLYGLDFFSIEFFFRGFMVLGFVAVCGPRIILPMALFYVVIHFGKPAGELVSSFFGGSLLGIIAYYSKSILGGIIVHVGIAWMMEIGAFIGQLFTS